MNALAKNITETTFQGVMETHKFLNRDMYRATLVCVKAGVVSDYINEMSDDDVLRLLNDYDMARAIENYKGVCRHEGFQSAIKETGSLPYRSLLVVVLRYFILIQTTTYKDYCAWRALQ